MDCLTPRSQNSETLAVESFSNLRGQQKEYHSEKAMAELYLLSYWLTTYVICTLVSKVWKSSDELKDKLSIEGVLCTKV